MMLPVFTNTCHNVLLYDNLLFISFDVLNVSYLWNWWLDVAIVCYCTQIHNISLITWIENKTENKMQYSLEITFLKSQTFRLVHIESGNISVRGKMETLFLQSTSRKWYMAYRIEPFPTITNVRQSQLQMVRIARRCSCNLYQLQLVVQLHVQQLKRF